MSNKIFFRINKKNVGPFSRRTVCQRLADQLDDEVTLDTIAWHPGLKEWTELKNILHPEEIEISKGGTPRYTRSDAKALRESEGIGRVGFLLSMGGIALISYLTLWGMERSGETDLVIYIAIAVVSLVCIGYRLRNIGVSGWWVLTLPIPPMCLVIPLACVMAPEHFADTRELDGSSFFAFVLLCGVAALAYLHFSAVPGQ